MKLLKKIVYSTTSRKYALYLLTVITLVLITEVYIGNKILRGYVIFGIGVLLSVLGINLLICTWLRVKKLFADDGSQRGSVSWIREQTHCALTYMEALSRLQQQLQVNGYIVSWETNLVTALKNKSGAWGSVIFHLGIVLTLVGFLVNSSWGFSSKVLIPEKVVVRIPQDAVVIEKGWLAKQGDAMVVALDSFTYGKPGVNPAQQVPEPEARLFFSDGQTERKAITSINYPASFRGLSFRYSDSGYSLLLKIESGGQLLVNDYANIASHGGKSWSDTVPVTDQLSLDAEFFPDYTSQAGTPRSRSRFPIKPVMKLAIREDGKIIGSALIPLNKSAHIGGYKVTLQGYRYWTALIVSNDPGRWVILIGAAAALAGLAWRTFKFNRAAIFSVEDHAEGTIIHWGVKTTYTEALFKEEIRSLLQRLEE